MVYPSITICKDLLTETFEDGNVDKPIGFPSSFDLNESIVKIIVPRPDGTVFEVDSYSSNLNNRDIKRHKVSYITKLAIKPLFSPSHRNSQLKGKLIKVRSFYNPGVY